MTATPNINIYTLGNNAYDVYISSNDPISYYVIRENGSIVAERYDMTGYESIYSVYYEGHVTETSTVTVETQSFNPMSFEGEIATRSIIVTYISPYSKLHPPIAFTCSLTNSTTVNYSFTTPENAGITGYSIDYAVSSGLGGHNANWMNILNKSFSTILNGGETYTGTLTINPQENNKYTLFRVFLWSVSEEFNSDYAQYSLPRYFPYTAQVVTADSIKPCITRLYQNDQWRQCKLNYYTLFPLMDINGEQIINTGNEPIYAAKKET